LCKVFGHARRQRMAGNGQPLAEFAQEI